MPQLSVIIVSYNVKFFLEQCLHSLQKATAGMDAEIIVVDNHSQDGTVLYLQPAFPNVQFMLNHQNNGFGKACNQGAAIATGAYILFLNPDTLLPEDCLQQVTTYMDEQDCAAALGIKMIDGSGNFLPESKRGFPSPSASFFKLSGISSLFPTSSWLSKYNLGHLDKDKIHPVEILSGAFMLVKKELFLLSGGFDEQFFMYGEDIDLSYRLQLQNCHAGKNYHNIYFGENSIIHFKGESLEKNSPAHTNVFYDAMKLFARKHSPSSVGNWFNGLIEAGIGLRKAITTIDRRRKQKAFPDKAEKKILVAGESTAFENISMILQQSGVNKNCIHFITCDAPVENWQQHLKQKILLENFTEVIFIAGFMSWKFIVDLLPQLPPNIFKKFHAAGSRSIVGSRDNASKGETYPLSVQS